MKITIESTDAVVDLNGKLGTMLARIWEGATETGIPVVCFVTRISPQTHDEAANERFAAELTETKKPTYEPFSRGIPLRFFVD